jgi:hypothetical protein
LEDWKYIEIGMVALRNNLMDILRTENIEHVIKKTKEEKEEIKIANILMWKNGTEINGKIAGFVRMATEFKEYETAIKTLKVINKMNKEFIEFLKEKKKRGLTL